MFSNYNIHVRILILVERLNTHQYDTYIEKEFKMIDNDFGVLGTNLQRWLKC